VEFLATWQVRRPTDDALRADGVVQDAGREIGESGGMTPRFLPVPLAGLEPATCSLGDNCQSSGLYGSGGSRQVRLGGHSGQCGLVRFSCGLWNDRENDH
jgi:hypothetical protein